MKRGLIVLALVVSFTFVLAGPGTGVDSIFQEMGHDKPKAWNTWDMDEKFSYLQNLGVYPDNGVKYQGHVTDLSGYFEVLGIVQPDNWYEMSFQEKKNYISENNVVVSERVVDELEESNQNIWFEIVGPILIVLVFAIVFFFFKMRKKD